jgi:hypothetical protein
MKRAALADVPRRRAHRLPRGESLARLRRNQLGERLRADHQLALGLALGPAQRGGLAQRGVGAAPGPRAGRRRRATAPWISRLAHRVLGDGQGPPGRADRSPQPGERTTSFLITSARSPRATAPRRSQPPRRAFARMWVHGRHLLVNGRKMSKRDGTFFTLRDLLDPLASGRPDVAETLGAHRLRRREGAGGACCAMRCSPINTPSR